jgi:hypothetical protein
MEFNSTTPADAAFLKTGLTVFRATRPSLVLFS